MIPYLLAVFKDGRTRKLMAIPMALLTRYDVDKLNVSRKEGRGGHVSIEVSVESSIQQLGYYIGKHGGRLITAT